MDHNKTITLIVSSIVLLLAGTFLLFYNGPVNKIGVADLTREISDYEEKNKEQFINEENEEEEPIVLVSSTPDIVKGIYLTGWSAGSESYMEYLFDLNDTTELNTVIIDVKDYSGYLSYFSEVEDVIRYGARQGRIRDIRGLIERLHERDIYVIARITIFQDPILAVNRPDLAVKSKAKLSYGFQGVNALWKDRSGLAWIDPSSRVAWDYNIAIAKEALDYGFDELNFDYIRFPSDGSLGDMEFPLWNRQVPRREVIRDFYIYLRQELPDAVLSADLFGLTTVNRDDLGIGQVIEDAYPYFDYVAPMIYPSHYARGFLGYGNPAEYPYQVVRYSVEAGLRRLKDQGTDSKLRPWIQDFSLGANYTPAMVKAQIDAMVDGMGEDYVGYMLWNSRNRYTQEAIQ